MVEIGHDALVPSYSMAQNPSWNLPRTTLCATAVGLDHFEINYHSTCLYAEWHQILPGTLNSESTLYTRAI
jgi:hypothetical protein